MSWFAVSRDSLLSAREICNHSCAYLVRCRSSVAGLYARWVKRSSANSQDSADSATPPAELPPPGGAPFRTPHGRSPQPHAARRRARAPPRPPAAPGQRERLELDSRQSERETHTVKSNIKMVIRAARSSHRHAHNRGHDLAQSRISAFESCTPLCTAAASLYYCTPYSRRARRCRYAGW